MLGYPQHNFKVLSCLVNKGTKGQKQLLYCADIVHPPSRHPNVIMTTRPVISHTNLQGILLEVKEALPRSRPPHSSCLAQHETMHVSAYLVCFALLLLVAVFHWRISTLVSAFTVKSEAKAKDAVKKWMEQFSIYDNTVSNLDISKDGDKGLKMSAKFTISSKAVRGK